LRKEKKTDRKKRKLRLKDMRQGFAPHEKTHALQRGGELTVYFKVRKKMHIPEFGYLATFREGGQLKMKNEKKKQYPSPFQNKYPIFCFLLFKQGFSCTHFWNYFFPKKNENKTKTIEDRVKIYTKATSKCFFDEKFPRKPHFSEIVFLKFYSILEKKTMALVIVFFF
jgi:hypothetical protein